MGLRYIFHLTIRVKVLYPSQTPTKGNWIVLIEYLPFGPLPTTMLSPCRAERVSTRLRKPEEPLENRYKHWIHLEVVKKEVQDLDLKVTVIELSRPNRVITALECLSYRFIALSAMLLLHVVMQG